ncbi:MAG: TonB-dependent receptor [Desulfuromonadales bacterium]|nr:TonB-dependent receptor [Desulfuromonadales bacterium]
MPCYVRTVLILFLIVLLSVPAAAQGEQPPLDTIEQLMNTEVTTVTGASKYQQELTDAPASVSIITSDDIRKGGFRNLAEVLNSVRGFYTTYVRSYHNIGVRGFSPLGDFNTRILLLVDGYRLNDGLYEAAPMGSDFPVDLDLIDRIEVIRGPGSSLYGTNAFLAVVNVITRSGKDIRGGELSVSGGSFNAWTGRATGGGKPTGEADLLFSGSYRDTSGRQRLSFPEYAATNNGIAQGLDGENSWDLLTKIAWKDFSLLLLHQTRDKAVPTAHYGTIFNDQGEKVGDRHTLAGLSYNHSGSWADVGVRLTYNRYGVESDYPNLDIDNNRTLIRDDNLGEWIGSDLLATKAIGDHLLTLGMEHRWQFTQRLHSYVVTPPAVGPVLNHHSLVQGYYLQDEYHILKQLILNAGLRFDHYDNFGSTTNPRAALIWKPLDTTVLRLTYGEAFRAPNAYEQFYGDGISQKGNPDLKPEKVRTVELGWEQYYGENIRTTLSGFYTRISDLLEQVTDTDGLLVFRNQRSVESKGIELRVEGKWENGFSGRLNYSYQDSKYLGSNQPVSNSPGSLLKGAVTVPLPLKKSFATLESVYSSSRLNVKHERVAGAAIFNLTLLNRDLLKGLDLSASIYNLFDTRYSAPSGPEHFNSLNETLREIPQDGITFRIKATYRF